MNKANCVCVSVCLSMCMCVAHASTFIWLQIFEGVVLLKIFWGDFVVVWGFVGFFELT